MTEWNYCPTCRTELIRSSDDLPTCPNGHFTKYATPVSSTLALVKNNNEYLVLRRARAPMNGAWDLPGGFVEVNETADQAICREIREETGIENLRIVEVLGTFPSDYAGTENVLTIGYIIESKTKNVILSEENDSFEWLAINDIPEMAFIDCQAAVKLLQQRINS